MAIVILCWQAYVSPEVDRWPIDALRRAESAWMELPVFQKPTFAVSEKHSISAVVAGRYKRTVLFPKDRRLQHVDGSLVLWLNI
jgi:hypothetical protein